MLKRISTLILILIACVAGTANASWSDIAERRVHALPLLSETSHSRDDGQPIPLPRAGQSLVGTWFVQVPASPGAEAFNAYQTFHAGGTMTETSDLLAALVEGPGHGGWNGGAGEYSFTFELFVFDEQHKPAGRIRVRGNALMNGPDRFDAEAAVDFIEPSGDVIENIGSTPFSATRVRVVGQ